MADGAYLPAYVNVAYLTLPYLPNSNSGSRKNRGEGRDRHETLENLHCRFLFHRVAWGHGCSEMGPGGDCHPLAFQGMSLGGVLVMDLKPPLRGQ